MQIYGIELTDDQARVATDPDSFFVEACPGAGKTRAIVARFLRRASEVNPRRGIAVLSFTNVATEEIQSRSAGRDAAAQSGFPNFVGTFDSFISRFFVLPFRSPWSDERPEILDSWARLRLSIRPRHGQAARGLTLDEMIPRIDGSAEIHLERIDQMIRRNVDEDREAWEAPAKQMLKGLHRAGYLTCADTRIVAVNLIRDPQKGLSLATALRCRFSEVIVDEAQDCNDEDLELIRWLRDAGINVVVVCDPDQAIYEFRGANPTGIRNLSVGLKTLSLSENFRSTLAICSCAATLRERREPDRPTGPHKGETRAVILYAFQRNEIQRLGELFAESAAQIEIPRHRIAILSHKESWAHRASGRAVLHDATGSGKAIVLADAVLRFRYDGVDPRQRLQAVEDVERRLLDLMDVNVRHLPKHEAIVQGLDHRWLRRTAHSILCCLPEPPADLNDVPVWLEKFRELVDGIIPPADFKFNRKKFPRAPKTRWMDTSCATSTIPAMSVHKAKGKQFGAVLLVVPPDYRGRTEELLDAWEHCDELEAKRVSYVAVTRAKRLLGIAVPCKFSQRVLRIFRRNAVPAEFIQVPTP